MNNLNESTQITICILAFIAMLGVSVFRIAGCEETVRQIDADVTIIHNANPPGE
jgi:hypothetical protein